MVVRNLLAEFKEHWKFNSVIGFIAVFVTDSIYLTAFYIIQSFFIMGGQDWNFIITGTERVRITLMFLTPIVFIQVFFLSWLGNFANKFNSTEEKVDKPKEEVIDWESI